MWRRPLRDDRAMDTEFERSPDIIGPWPEPVNPVSPGGKSAEEIEIPPDTAELKRSPEIRQPGT